MGSKHVFDPSRAPIVEVVSAPMDPPLRCAELSDRFEDFWGRVRVPAKAEALRGTPPSKGCHFFGAGDLAGERSVSKIPRKELSIVSGLSKQVVPEPTPLCGGMTSPGLRNWPPTTAALKGSSEPGGAKEVRKA